MEGFKAFLKRKNIEISAKRYGIDALGAMAQGLFCSLLIGTIIKTLGQQLSIQYLIDIGAYAMSVSGPAMSVAIGYALKADPMVLFSLAAVGWAANAEGGAGGPLAVLITAIGVSYFLQNAAQLLWGATPKNFTSLVTFPVPEFLAKYNVSAVSLVTIVACLIIMAGLVFFTGKTKMGKAMRAVSEDKAAAQLMGINVNRTISMTFAIGSALAAIAGVLLCSYSPVLQPTTGSMPGIKAFTAAVFGGIGSIPGAFVGGILLGIIEAMAQAYISTSLANSIVFGVLIVVLLVKPAGLFGKYVPEKV